MKKIKYHQTIVFLFYALFFILLLRNSLSYLDPDLGWHLKMGEDISIYKKVNYENYYNFIFSNNDNYWINHEWLSDFLLFQGYSNFGYITVSIVFALVILLSIYLLNSFLIKNIITEKKFLLYLMPLELIGLIASLPHFGIRIQEISVLFVLLLFIILYNFEQNISNNKKFYWKNLVLLIPLIYLWSNLHAGFLLGISLLFFYFGIKVVEKIILKYQNFSVFKFFKSFFSFKTVLSCKNLAIMMAFSLISILTTTINPYGLKLFNFLFQYKNTAYLKNISEWLPQYSFPFMYWQILYIGIIITIIGIGVVSNYKKNKKILTLWSFSIAILFILLSLKSRRHFPLLFISTFTLIAEILFKEFGNLPKNSKKNSNNISTFLIKIYLIICFVSTISAILITSNFNKNPFSYFCTGYPCGAIKFLKYNTNFEETRIFNSYVWGGFLINQYPEQKIFIDGRQPQKPFKNHSYLEEYLLFYSNDTIIEEKIDEYNINLFLLKKTQKIKLNWLDKNIFNLREEKINNNENKLIHFLNNNSAWEKIYEDETSLVYQKK